MPLPHTSPHLDILLEFLGAKRPANRMLCGKPVLALYLSGSLVQSPEATRLFAAIARGAKAQGWDVDTNTYDVRTRPIGEEVPEGHPIVKGPPSRLDAAIKDVSSRTALREGVADRFNGHPQLVVAITNNPTADVSFSHPERWAIVSFDDAALRAVTGASLTAPVERIDGRRLPMPAEISPDQMAAATAVTPEPVVDLDAAFGFRDAYVEALELAVRAITLKDDLRRRSGRAAARLPWEPFPFSPGGPWDPTAEQERAAERVVVLRLWPAPSGEHALRPFSMDRKGLEAGDVVLANLHQARWPEEGRHIVDVKAAPWRNALALATGVLLPAEPDDLPSLLEARVHQFCLVRFEKVGANPLAALRPALP